MLSGNVAERVRDLRRENNLSMEQLGKAVNVDKSTVSRIENGEPFKCDIALSLAEYFGVSTDYLFGLTDDKSPVNYDLKKLGISSAAAEKLCLEEVDPDIVNLLIEHPDFKNLSIALALYLTDAIATDVRIHNTVCDEVSRIIGYVRSEGSADLSHKIQNIKYPDINFDLTIIQNMFANMIIDIKSGMKSTVKKEEKTIREIVAALEKSIGKHNLAIRRINADKMARGVVDAFSVKYSLTEEERNNLIEALKPLFVKDVRKGKN
ncbi:MAG: helix-turn-helix transcriptional regulator [Clostridia bacterium]|nr:helix-turn-helix transcriptional regulator [Clostridia bacterium]